VQEELVKYEFENLHLFIDVPVIVFGFPACATTSTANPTLTETGIGSNCSFN
jgi:hypothetical protein